MSQTIYTDNDRRFQNINGVVRDALNDHATAINILDNQSGTNQRVVNTASPSAILLADGLILFDTTSTAISIDLPAASGLGEVRIKDIGANSSLKNITFNAVGSDTIVDSSTGQTTTIIASDGFSGSFQNNGVDTWYLM